MKKEICILTMEDKSKRIYLEDYVRAKLKALREFGYPDLTYDEVKRAAQKVLNKEELTDVIEMMMENEISMETK